MRLKMSKKFSKIARAFFIICIKDMTIGFTDASYERRDGHGAFCG